MENTVNIVDFNNLHHYDLQKLIERNELNTSRNCEYLDNQCTIEPLSLVNASGRSKCRITGNLIPKGSLVIKGYYDFTGAGSYTAQQIYISVEAYNQKLLENTES